MLNVNVFCCECTCMLSVHTLNVLCRVYMCVGCVCVECTCVVC